MSQMLEKLVVGEDQQYSLVVPTRQLRGFQASTSCEMTGNASWPYSVDITLFFDMIPIRRTNIIIPTCRTN